MGLTLFFWINNRIFFSHTLSLAFEYGVEIAGVGKLIALVMVIVLSRSSSYGTKM